MGKSDPPPQVKSSAKDGALKSLVGVQSFIRLGLFLPAAVVIGWAMGLVLDRWLNQHSIDICGRRRRSGCSLCVHLSHNF